MIFLGYVLSFLLLNVLLRRVNRRLRDVLILGYNVAFAAVMHFIRLAEPPMDLPGFFATLGDEGPRRGSLSGGRRLLRADRRIFRVPLHVPLHGAHGALAVFPAAL